MAKQADNNQFFAQLSEDDQKELLANKLQMLRESYLDFMKKVQALEDQQDDLRSKILKSIDHAKMEQILNKIHKQ